MAYLLNRSKKYSYILFLVLGLLFIPFQNCSKTQFSINQSSLNAFSAQDIIVENNRLATNKKVLSVQIIQPQNTKSDIKIYEENNGPDSVDWVPVTENMSVDLLSQFAAGGVKDTYKKIIAEFKSKLDNKIIKVEKTILLDTLSPSISGEGILIQGLVGGTKVYTKNEILNISWKAKDMVAPTGNKSDLDTQEAIKFGWSKLADCSESNVKDMSAPMPNDNQAAFKWPVSDPLDTFYICVYVKDNAGNTSTLLSQPLSYQWTVLVGDNNLGSGGSITSKNVRFNSPSDIEIDNEGQLYIMDNRYEQLRRVNKDGIIETILGNLSPGTISDKAAGFVGLQMSFDSQNRLHFLGSGIERLEKDPSDQMWKRKRIFSAPGLGAMVIKKSKTDGDMIYVGLSTVIGETSAKPEVLPTADVYLLKIPMVDIEANLASKKIDYSVSELLAKYHIAGNGSTYISSEPKEFEQEALKDRMGYIRSIDVDDNGDIYVSTHADGVGRPYGEHAIRLIKKNAQNILTNYLLVSNANWIFDLKIAKIKNQKYLIFAGYGQLKSINLSTELNPDFFTEKKPLLNDAKYSIPALSTLMGSNASSYVFMGLAIQKTSETEADIYVTHQSGAVVARLNSQLDLVETYGRPPYADADTGALSSALNNPTSLVQDKAGNVLIVETPSCIIRKMNSQSQLSILAGIPCSVPTSVVKAEVPMNNAFTHLSGLTSFFSGYTGTIAYNKVSDKFYVGNGAPGKIIEIDQVNKTGQLFSFTDRNLQSSHPIFGMSQVLDNGNDPYVYVSRRRTVIHNNVNPGAVALEKVKLNVPAEQPELFVGNILNENVALAVTDNQDRLQTKMNYSTNAIAIDTNEDMYYGQYTSNGKTQLIRVRAGQQKVITEIPGGLISIALERTSQSLRFYFLNSDASIQHMEISLDVAPKIVSSLAKLCFKGSYLLGAQQIFFSNDKALLIADSNNNRIIKYYLYDKNGQFNLNVCQ